MSRPGLTTEEAERFLALDGPNIVAEHRKFNRLSLFLSQFSSPSILILITTAVIYGILGNFHDSLILLAIIVPSGLLTFFQEHRAAMTLAELRQRLSSNVTVIRDGKDSSIAIEDLVRGDCIRLSAGDPVPADAVILQSKDLLADESVITGESLPREKDLQRDFELFKGTHLVGGHCIAKVIRTGRLTKFGEMAARLTNKDSVTSFERGVREFGFFVARSIFFLVILVFLGNLALGRPIFTSLLFSLALAIGLTPQMLPVIISICLSHGARLLAKERVLIRRLDAVEDLGSLATLCTDKTGTLTEGRLAVVECVDPFGTKAERVTRLAFENAINQSMNTGAIHDAILATRAVQAPRTKASEIPFTFERRISKVTFLDGESVTVGAVSEVLELCAHARSEGGPRPIAVVNDRIHEVVSVNAAQGFKVLAVASSRLGESNETLEGFLMLSDPVKHDAKDSVAKLHLLGIEVALVTGDNLGTARYVAAQVGIPTVGSMTGKELLSLSKEALALRVTQSRVFAEVTPDQKVMILEAMRANDKAIGFLGDGINDAAALKSADVSISVDDASEIARSASSIVLLEKDLGVIADGVRLGRKTFENTMKYIKITISASFGNVLSMALASFFLPFLPLLPTQILLLNFLSDLPAVAISSDSVDEEQVRSPRSWSMRGLGHFMVFFGLISTIFDLTLFFLVLSIMEASEGMFRSIWFFTSLLTEVIAIFTLRTQRFPWRSRPSATLILFSIGTIGISIVVMSTGILKQIGLPPIAPLEILISFTIGISYLMATEVGKRRSRVFF